MAYQKTEPFPVLRLKNKSRFPAFGYPVPFPEPVTHDQMMLRRYHGHNTICQILRDIYCMTDDEGIGEKCRLAMGMAKKMQNKLKEYRSQNTTTIKEV